MSNVSRRFFILPLLMALTAMAFVPAASAQDKPECFIEVKGECDKLQLCGPDDLEWSWSTGEKTQCISVTVSGNYELTVTDPQTKLTEKCDVDVKVEPCERKEACPRTPGYWWQQARQEGNGSTKFSRSQVISIAECVDGLTSVFSWGSGEAALAAFANALNPPRPMTTEKQFRRHLAAFLANVCATGVTPTHGGEVFLSLGTEIECNGATITVQDLIDMIHASGDPASFKDCLAGVNEGETVALAPSCSEKKVEDSGKDLAIGALRPSTLIGGGSVELYRPYPNPFTGTMRMSYAVGGQGELVDIGVYDVAGRRVQTLARGHMPNGVHEISWDGSSLNGGRVGVGVYFVRGLIGERSVYSRVLLVD